MQNSTIRNTAASVSPFHYEKQSSSALKGELIVKAHFINNSKGKRLFDILFSLLVVCLVFSWLFPIIALLIKLTSRGPVFFIQDRVGLNGNIFKCYKFRTMKTAPVKYMYTPTDSSDSRITAIGRFLRDSSLDELPQFINVLKGDMSIVGPRPHPIAFHKTYASFVDTIDNRLLVKPGITGLAQIQGYRGDVKDFEINMLRTKKRVAFDILYIKLWTLKRDIWIVYTTFMQVTTNKSSGL